MENKYMYIIIFLASVFISSIAQVVLKKSADKTYGSKIKEYLNPLVIGAYIVFFGSSLLTTIAYKGVPLSLGPILESSGYIYITVLGIFFLREKVSAKKFIGNILIILGILISYFG